jgi:IMP dehydrogenase
LISLNIPIVGSPIDTVTEDRMAIALTLLGGIGFIHYNNTIEEQADLVSTVKRFENGIIRNPIVFSPHHTIEDIDLIRKKMGFSGIPITQDGSLESPLVGIVTSRDIDLQLRYTTKG